MKITIDVVKKEITLEEDANVGDLYDFLLAIDLTSYTIKAVKHIEVEKTTFVPYPTTEPFQPYVPYTPYPITPFPNTPYPYWQITCDGTGNFVPVATTSETDKLMD